MTELTDLDAELKRSDPDRWLAARFIADPQARADVLALYGLDHVTARIPAQVSEPMMGHIRLAWWREAIEELAAGQPPRAHPVVEALADPIRRRVFDPTELDALVDARAGNLEAEPFAHEAALYAHIDATDGRVAALAARRLDPASPADATTEAMRAWWLAQLRRDSRLPPSIGLADAPRRVARHLEAARRDLKALPVAAFPAVAHAALSLPYAKGRAIGQLEKRLRLLGATLAGRI
jgi:phytoene synthase